MLQTSAVKNKSKIIVAVAANLATVHMSCST